MFPVFLARLLRGSSGLENKFDAAAKHILWQHVVFFGQARNVVHDEGIVAIFLLFRLDRLAESDRVCKGGGSESAARRMNGEIGFAGEQILLNGPANIPVIVAVSLNFVFVFDDAAWLHIGHSEGFFEHFDTARLDDFLFEDLTGERNDGAIGTHGACADVLDGVAAFYERNLDIALLLALFGKDLDAVVFGSDGVGSVGELLAVKNHGVGARTGGIVF
ncbi:MAG: hypothetical protein WBG29_13575, partial [Candidatus Acidiferrales bacterium]